MPDVRFVVNLRNLTVDPLFRRRLRPSGFLAAPAYLTPSLRRAAAALSGRGLLLVADNGLFDDITRITAEMRPETAALTLVLKELRMRLGRVPRSRDLNDQTTADLKGLADRVGVRAASVGSSGTLPGRLALHPTAIIGAEDITAALWLRLGLDTSLPRARRQELRRRNAAVARASRRESGEVSTNIRYLPVASAIDYDSAYDAGRVFADSGLVAAACGFGAFMADDSFTDSAVIRGRVRPFPRRLPHRYLRTALVARGFWDGWEKEQGPGTGPEAFHFLGLGAPIMIAIAALAARNTPLLTFDATSPIKDAAEATLYIPRPAYLKIRTWRAAERLSSDEKQRWPCPCPFCRAFVRAHRFDYEAGARWRTTTGSATVGPKDLREGAPLALAYPLLSQPPVGPMRAELASARIGHNHWALERICEELRQASDLDLFVGQVTTDYERESRGPLYALALRTALDIVRGNLP